MENFIFSVLIYCLAVLVVCWKEVRYRTERYELLSRQFTTHSNGWNETIFTTRKELRVERHNVAVLEDALQEIKDALPLMEKKEQSLRRIRIEEEG
jgi:hypothetical protein